MTDNNDGVMYCTQDEMDQKSD